MESKHYIHTKVIELKARLVSDDIDVCTIQETKLTENSKLPSFTKKGYDTIRTDVKLTNAGEGLLFLVRSTLVVEPLDAVALEATETMSIKVRLEKNKWVYITNVYTPPEHTIGQDVIKLRYKAANRPHTCIQIKSHMW